MENSGKKNWLYGVIALLALALVVETGFLIYQIGSKPAKEEAVVKAERSPRLARRSVRPYYAHRATGTPTYQDYWHSLFEEMRRLQEEMGRTFDESLGRVRRSPAMQAPVASFFHPAGFPDFSPAIDLEETEDAYIAKADLPGIEKEKIQVSVSGNVLIVRGERKEEVEKEEAERDFYRLERSYGSFSRSLTLPGPVDEAGVVADYQNGVLTITLPKLKGEQAEPKQVTVG